jgi:hypothetical protein
MTPMSGFLESVRLDKTAFSVTTLGDDSRDLAYWLSKTPEERLAAVEFLRVMNYGYDPATARLQRVLRVSKLGES